jgi:diguanylate cyclase
MHPTAMRRTSSTRLFWSYTAVRLALVVALGLVLASIVRGGAHEDATSARGAEARLLESTEVVPVLHGEAPDPVLGPAARQALDGLTAAAQRAHEVVGLRLIDAAGRTAFADGASAAAHAGLVATHVPIVMGTPARSVGTLEVYFAPAAAPGWLGRVDRDLALGLAALFLALLGIALLVNAGFRRQIRARTYLAEHDALTELPNRSAFHRRATAAVRGDGDDEVTVAILDLDRFKVINDTLGHSVGDALLAELAGRLDEQLRPGDTLARLGGDEFGLVLHDCADPAATLWRVRTTIEREVAVRGLPLSIDASIGYVSAAGDVDADVLLQHAEIAMYEAKARHAGILRYDPSQDHYDEQNLVLAGELRHAIDGDQLVLHYQPKVALQDRRARSFEALVRWQHPTLGRLAPDRFVPLAEQSDLIDHLTGWVLRRALQDLCELGRDAEPLSVAVNVSARNLGRPGLPVLVAHELELAGLAAERLVVEMTETALLADPAAATDVLEQLSSMGVAISLDDFGSGQTSLGYVSSLPIDELKIDRQFVAGLCARPADAAIVRSIVDLGHHLELRVVAEGIEDDATWNAVAATGCDLAQGYLMARPMPLDELGVWLGSRQAATLGR